MVLSSSQRVAVIVTSGAPETLREMTRVCSAAAQSGASVRVFFRDESIPAIVRRDRSPFRQPAASWEPGSGDDAPHRAPVGPLLEALAAAGDVRLYACSSSLYIWGVEAGDLDSAVHGSRGLIAFLAEDLAGASSVLTF